MSQEFAEWGFPGHSARSTAALVFSCCERLSRTLCSLPVLSVEKPAKQKSEVLGCNSQTVFKRVMLYCIFPFIYKECLAFVCAAVPAIHLEHNHALLHKQRSSLKSGWSQRRSEKKAFICPSSDFLLDRHMNFCHQCDKKQPFLFIEVLTFHSEPKHNWVLTVSHFSSKWKV